MSDARDEIRRAVVSLALELPQGVYTDFYNKIMNVLNEKDDEIAKLKKVMLEAADDCKKVRSGRSSSENMKTAIYIERKLRKALEVVK